MPKKKISKRTKSKKRQISIVELVIVTCLFALGILLLLSSNRFKNFTATDVPTTTQKIATSSIYVQFIREDLVATVQDQYWDIITDQQIYDNFINIVGGLDPATNTLASLYEALDQGITSITTTEQKISFTKGLANKFLQSLPPTGRSALYSEAKSKELWDTVKNIDDNTDLYKETGLNKASSTKQITEALTEKKEAAQNVVDDENANDEEKIQAVKEVKIIERAEETLTNDKQRSQYDSYGTEATVLGRHLTPEIDYIKLAILSPFSVEELVRIDAKLKTSSSAHLLIFDLRGNIGGYIDSLPVFLSAFVGPNQLAYEWYQQKNYKSFTTVNWKDGANFDRYKEIILLTDGRMQSSAEVIASALKKLGRSTLVGTKTYGWGGVERLFPVTNQFANDETYQLYLVHHLTVRADRQPIETRGISPHVNILEKNWKKTLLEFYPNEELASEVEKLISK